MNRLVNRRIRLFLAALGLAFVGLLLRATWLQAVRAESLSSLGQTQQRQSVTIPAGRGTLFDRSGLELALGEQATTVYANPMQITNPRRAALAVERTLGLNADRIFPTLVDRTHGFVYVARQADPAQAAALQRLKLPGFGFYPEERRNYPQRSVASQVLGFVGTDGNGLSGLELQFDHSLAGRAGKETIVKDPSGRVIDVQGERPEVPGRDVYLTLDHSIQANAEQVLRETVHKWAAKSASAIVLDPRTGAILAMAVQPGFDANRFPSAPSDLQRNRTVTDTYEPGSTFKLITVAGALSERIVTPTTRFTLPYSLQVADRVIHDAEKRGIVHYSVAQILAHSSNIGAITLAQMLGRTRLSAWITKFGFGRTTGVDFPGESPGIVLPPDKWSGSTIGNVPIGQGIAVTPVQMAAAYAAIANRGVWSRPHLVDHVAGGARPSLNRRRLVSPKIAKQLMSMLKDVVAEGTGQYAAMPGYQVAGKTGTAQKPDSRGGYATGRYVASFVGIVPASRPRFVILVAVDEPRGAIWGGTVAAPAFQQIARFDLQYLEVPPDAASGH
ncbi:MAG: penicillin-binding protein 2 [Actinobacteria bacterium]|nr:MAG: penicillin-binding protein 2 [Actinomycetota bacterium]TML84516.1 MAG: penicillin-binding protein 2 [Actinomycetota bacterium]